KNVNGIPQTPSNLVELWQEREKIKNTIISEIIKLGIDENQESTWKAESRNPNGFVLENYKKLVTPEVYNVLKECFEKAQEEITRPSFKYN
ncbi:MAG: hypothetical protein HYX60_10650, partial [Legionella longbeachae]|nr:hypothetical protein [Legionella longbeachae]